MNLKLLWYCTKNKPYLQLDPFDLTGSTFRVSDDNLNNLNGKIVVESDSAVEEIMIIINKDFADAFPCPYLTKKISPYGFLTMSCLTADMIKEYNPNYAIYINNLKIFDKPKELKDFYIKGTYHNPEQMFTDEIQINGEWFHPMQRAPQNMCYAFDKQGNKYVVISIHPEWLCLILNKKKYVELRREVLKEML